MTDKLEGEIVKGTFAEGSKSEREAIFLLVEEEQRYVLRREGGNPFKDQVLDTLVGKYIRAEGTIHKYTFIINKWTEIDHPE